MVRQPADSSRAAFPYQLFARKRIIMSEIRIRRAAASDLDACLRVESGGFPPAEAAERETIATRIRLFPEGFYVAEWRGREISVHAAEAYECLRMVL